MPDRYVLLKRGLFYRPNANGYTGLRREAGLYSREDAEAHALHMGNSVTMMAAAEAPEFSPACWDETKMAELRRQLGDAAAYQAAVDRTRPRDILSRVRSIIRGRVRQQANWILAMEVFGLGSTFAWRLCVEEGIDPDGFDSTLVEESRP